MHHTSPAFGEFRRLSTHLADGIRSFDLSPSRSKRYKSNVRCNATGVRRNARKHRARRSFVRCSFLPSLSSVAEHFSTMENNAPDPPAVTKDARYRDAELSILRSFPKRRRRLRRRRRQRRRGRVPEIAEYDEIVSLGRVTRLCECERRQAGEASVFPSCSNTRTKFYNKNYRRTL